MSVSSIAESGLKIEEDADGVWISAVGFSIHVSSVDLGDGVVMGSVWKGEPGHDGGPEGGFAIEDGVVAFDGKHMMIPTKGRA